MLKNTLLIVVILVYFIAKIVKIAKTHTFLAKDDHFVVLDCFAKFFARNEAHESYKISLKNKSLSKLRRATLLPEEYC